MNHQDQSDEFIQQLFQTQQEKERANTPSFAECFENAQLKHQKMKKTKWFLTGLVIIMASLMILSFSAKDAPTHRDAIEVATASISLYEQLQKDGKIVTNDIHFDYDKASIRESSMGIIKEIADMLEKHPEIKLSIEGHTDDSGSSAYNLELSSIRAQAVKATLVKLSISPQRLSAKGYGESKPLTGNTNEASRAKNRRVEFIRQ